MSTLNDKSSVCNAHVEANGDPLIVQGKYVVSIQYETDNSQPIMPSFRYDRSSMKDDLREQRILNNSYNSGKGVLDVLTDEPDSLAPISFEGNEHLIKISFPPGIKTINKNMFAGCKRLSSVTLPDALEEIRESAFTDCESLKSLCLPTNVKKIDTFAFSNAHIPELSIPSSVQELGNHVFSRAEIDVLRVDCDIKSNCQREIIWDWHGTEEEMMRGDNFTYSYYCPLELASINKLILGKNCKVLDFHGYTYYRHGVEIIEFNGHSSPRLEGRLPDCVQKICYPKDRHSFEVDSSWDPYSALFVLYID